MLARLTRVFAQPEGLLTSGLPPKSPQPKAGQSLGSQTSSRSSDVAQTWGGAAGSPVVSSSVRIGLGVLGSIALVCGLAACATTSGDLSQPTELAKETLRSDDCPLAVAAFRQRLQLPPNAGVVVSNRSPEPLSEQEQETRAALFSLQCQAKVGTARRALLRCWLDALDATSFMACNDRF